MNNNYYIIQLGGPLLYLKNDNVDYELIFTLTGQLDKATKFSESEANSIGIILSREFIIIDIETHLKNINKQK